MSSTKVSFNNINGDHLTGRLELPTDQHPHNFVIFAHCFTCTKNLSAVRNISRALTNQGFGVLRFDFTGLGESEGDFKETNFTSTVDDLIAAADFLISMYKAPTLIIGHSLGGTASILAASKLASIKAVVTIGSPFDPAHVTHLLKDDLEVIKTQGASTVELGGRKFTIKKQFIEDLKKQSIASTIQNLDKALLVMHAPQDATVEIKNAEQIYQAARHPKSFITLDGADHLLLHKEDSLYAGEVIAGWSRRYVKIPKKTPLNSSYQVTAKLPYDAKYTTQLRLGDHTLTADEPETLGGNNFGPTPFDLVAAGLASCTTITLKMYAERKAWEFENIVAHVTHKKDEKNATNIFERIIKIDGDINEKQLKRLLQIADKCPVHKMLEGHVMIHTKILDKSATLF